MDLDNDFGHWLAGFVDGEGSFNCAIYVPKGRVSAQVVPNFVVALRKDDEAVLQECQKRVGTGRLYQFGGNDSRNPQVRWTVNTKSGCQKIVEVFTQYPLRAKKARDFAIWADIVKLHGERRRNGKQDDLDKIRGLVYHLQQQRKYPTLTQTQEV